MAIYAFDTLTNEERGDLYSHQLYRYRNYSKQVREQQSIRLVRPRKGDSSSSSSTPCRGNNHSSRYRKPSDSECQQTQVKESRIVFWAFNKKQTCWTRINRRKLKYRGPSIPDSNVVDLVSGSLRFHTRKCHPATGRGKWWRISRSFIRHPQALPYRLHAQNQKVRENIESLSFQQVKPIMKEEKTDLSRPDFTRSLLTS